MSKKCPRCNSELKETKDAIVCPNGDFKATKSKWYSGETCSNCGEKTRVLMENFTRVGTYCPNPECI